MYWNIKALWEGCSFKQLMMYNAQHLVILSLGYSNIYIAISDESETTRLRSKVIIEEKFRRLVTFGELSCVQCLVPCFCFHFHGSFVLKLQIGVRIGDRGVGNYLIVQSYSIVIQSSCPSSPTLFLEIQNGWGQAQENGSCYLCSCSK